MYSECVCNEIGKCGKNLPICIEICRCTEIWECVDKPVHVYIDLEIWTQMLQGAWVRVRVFVLFGLGLGFSPVLSFLIS